MTLYVSPIKPAARLDLFGDGIRYIVGGRPEGPVPFPI